MVSKFLIFKLRIRQREMHGIDPRPRPKALMQVVRQRLDQPNLTRGELHWSLAGVSLYWDDYRIRRPYLTSRDVLSKILTHSRWVWDSFSQYRLLWIQDGFQEFLAIILKNYKCVCSQSCVCYMVEREYVAFLNKIHIGTKGRPRTCWPKGTMIQWNSFAKGLRDLCLCSQGISSNCLTLGKVPNFFRSQFSQPWNRRNNTLHLPASTPRVIAKIKQDFLRKPFALTCTLAWGTRLSCFPLYHHSNALPTLRLTMRESSFTYSGLPHAKIT